MGTYRPSAWLGSLFCLMVFAGASRADVQCPPGPADDVEALPDGSGHRYPNWRLPGDDPAQPKCELYCIRGCFYVVCDGKWLHRCPYLAGHNTWGIVNGRFKGKSVEGGVDGVPSDDDHDGVKETVEYEEVVDEAGRCFLVVRTYHDGRLVEPVRRVPCPTRREDLPPPIEPPPPAGDPIQPPAGETEVPVLTMPWFGAMLLVISLAVLRRCLEGHRSLGGTQEAP